MTQVLQYGVLSLDLLQSTTLSQTNPLLQDVVTEEGIPPHSVLSLRLDYKNILKIDNLYHFTSLEKLCLDNNIIETITNLSHLINLTWLDLSYNNITTITGLDTLVNLTDLSLHANNISRIENLDNMKQLTCFSIGENQISSFEDITYLKRFGNLRVLNLAGNPVSKEKDYKNFVLSRLSKMKYLDYTLVNDEDVKKARHMYIDALIAIDEEDKIQIAQELQSLHQQQLESVYTQAHVPNIDSFINSLFINDNDFQKLSPLVMTSFDSFQTDALKGLSLKINSLKEFALQKMEEKKCELISYRECMDETQKMHDTICLERISEFTSMKKKIVHTLQTDATSDVDTLLEKLSVALGELIDTLLTHETTLTQKHASTITDFCTYYTDIQSSLIEFSTTLFVSARELLSELGEKFGDFVTASVETIQKLGEEIDEKYVVDKELLDHTVQLTHEYRLGRLDYVEDIFLQKSQKEAERVIKEVQEEHVQRNRKRVEEILSFRKKIKSEILQLEDMYA